MTPLYNPSSAGGLTSPINESDTTNLINDLAYVQGGHLVPTGITYANFDRMATSLVNGGAATAGTLRCYAIWLPTGFTVTSITFMSGTTGLTTSGTAPHAWFALLDSSRNVLRQSTDVTNLTWSASSLKTLNLSSTFVTTYTGLHYIGQMIHCGSTGTMQSVMGSNDTNNALAGTVPILAGNSTTGEGATATSPATALTALQVKCYGGVG